MTYNSYSLILSPGFLLLVRESLLKENEENRKEQKELSVVDGRRCQVEVRGYYWPMITFLTLFWQWRTRMFFIHILLLSPPFQSCMTIVINTYDFENENTDHVPKIARFWLKKGRKKYLYSLESKQNVSQNITSKLLVSKMLRKLLIPTLSKCCPL